jgi:hypothetical protein
MRVISRKVAIAAAAAAVAVGALSAAPAQADRTRNEASGNSTIQFSKQFLKALQSGGCGALTATSTGGATVFATGSGAVKTILPVTALVFADSGAFRIAHSTSGVELSNACYDVTFSNFYIQDLGSGQGGPLQAVSFDVLAKTKSVDENNQRQLLFTLDLTPATAFSVDRPKSTTYKIRSMNLDLAQGGVAEFNQLATGDETVGPFTDGQIVGKAKTTVFYRTAPTPVRAR